MKKILVTNIILFGLSMVVYKPGFAQVPAAFPPPPPVKSPIEGTMDFHVHSGPDVFGRSLTDIEVARLAKRAGMKGLVLKNHITSTADRAYLAMQQVPGLEVFGGIVLNRAVGGINPTAVEWMHRMEGGRGKVVWLPSFDADHHLKTFRNPGEGLKVAEGGKLYPETEVVLKVVAREDLVLHTCHVSPEETLLVIEKAIALGVRKIVVTHAMSDVPGLSLDQMKKAASMGAYLELVFVNHLMGPDSGIDWMKNWKQVSIGDMAKAIREIGAEHFILSSDLGQSMNPTHTDGYIQFITDLKKEGIPQEALDLMAKTNPAKLLGLE